MQITGKQIRAARVLAEWDAGQLGERVDINRVSIQNIERGVVNPKIATIEKIIKVFAEHRIEFTAGEGVRFMQEDVEVLNGEEGLSTFFDKIYTIASIKGCHIRQIGIAEKLFDMQAPTVTAAHRERMTTLVNTKRNVFVKAILDQNDKNFVCTAYADYRAFPKDFPNQIPFYTFDDMVGIFSFASFPSPKIILINSPTIAAAYNTQFEEIWDMSKTPSALKWSK